MSKPNAVYDEIGLAMREVVLFRTRRNVELESWAKETREKEQRQEGN